MIEPTQKPKISKSLIALSPLFLFVALFIGSGLYFSFLGHQYAFYQISPAVAIIPAILLAVILARFYSSTSIAPITFQKALSVFLDGARDRNIIIMCLIYLLAGAFGSVLQNIGAINSTVYLALSFVPSQAILPALFLISAVISTAMGTSMGTIAAIGPIGVGIATVIGIPLPLTMGAIIGGAMFGDNLSMISDTTIAATQIQGCAPKDKFKSNAAIALPTMVVTVLLLIFIGNFTNLSEVPLEITGLKTGISGEYQISHCLPYLAVLLFALLGMNVFVVLLLGIAIAAAVGLTTLPGYSLIILAKNIFDGYKSMSEILILSLLMGGLGELIKFNGGFSFFTNILDYFKSSKQNHVYHKKIAEAAISTVASLSDICTANNTAAIILSGEATKTIAKDNHISPARAATLVDLFACVFQGILPYSAQVLMAGSLAGISPLEIVPNVHYCYLLGISGVLAILLQLPRFSVKINTISVSKAIIE